MSVQHVQQSSSSVSSRPASLQGFASTVRIADTTRCRNPVDTSRTGLLDAGTPCAGCPSPILAGAPRQCVAGDGPARSTDSEGRVRHPTCEVRG